MMLCAKLYYTPYFDHAIHLFNLFVLENLIQQNKVLKNKSSNGNLPLLVCTPPPSETVAAFLCFSNPDSFFVKNMSLFLTSL